MGVVTLKSAAITNRDTVPLVQSNSILAKGTLVEAVGLVTTSATDSSASKFIFCQVPSNARISQILLSADDSGTTGLMDIGVWQTTENGGAVVDQDFFASAVDLNAAALAMVDVTHEADAADAGAGYGRADVEKPLWQALGLSSDPKRDYDIVGYLTEAVLAASDINLRVRYVI